MLYRNVDELLQETRVATAGVQLLFAFLLGLPFTTRFGSLGTFDTTACTVTLLSTAVAALLPIAPLSFHRVRFRQREKRALVASSDRVLLAGLVLLLVGIVSAVLLVLDVAWDAGRRWVAALRWPSSASPRGSRYPAGDAPGRRSEHLPRLGGMIRTGSPACP